MNRFDQQLGYYDNNLGGIGSSLKKALKKAGKAVKSGVSNINRTRLKIDDKLKPVMTKITPKPIRGVNEKIRKLGREADKKGITKIAAAAAISFFNPVVGGKLASLAVSAAKAAAVKSLQNEAVKDYGEYQTTKLIDSINTDTARVLRDAVMSVPEFQQVWDALRQEGYSDADIAQHWVESRAYYEGSTQAVADTIYPAVLQQTQQMGVPQEWQQPIAEQVALNIGAEQTEKVQAEVTGKSNIPLLILGAALLALGG